MLAMSCRSCNTFHVGSCAVFPVWEHSRRGRKNRYTHRVGAVAF